MVYPGASRGNQKARRYASNDQRQPGRIPGGLCRKLSKEARQKKWEELLADLENNPDPVRTWRTAKSLSGTPFSITFAEPLLHKGRTFTTNRGKANVFVQEYAAVSRLRFNKEEGNRTRQLKLTLKSPTAE